MGKKIHKCNGPDKADVIRAPASEPPPRKAATPACSGCPDIKIDPDFQFQLPPLSVEEEAQLEQNVLREGCREALVVWKGPGLLLDGHHRYAICIKHNLPFSIREVELEDDDAAVAWIDNNQDGRRNTTPEDMSYQRGRRYNAQKKEHGGNRRGGKTSGQKDHMKTDEAVATYFKVSPKTIRRDGEFAAAVDTLAANCGQEVRRFLLTRAVKLSRGAVRRLSLLDRAEQRKVVKQMLESGEIPASSGKTTAWSPFSPPDPKKLALLLLKLWNDQTIDEFRKTLTRCKKQRDADRERSLFPF